MATGRQPAYAAMCEDLSGHDIYDRMRVNVHGPGSLHTAAGNVEELNRELRAAEEALRKYRDAIAAGVRSASGEAAQREATPVLDGLIRAQEELTRFSRLAHDQGEGFSRHAAQLQPVQSQPPNLWHRFQGAVAFWAAKDPSHDLDAFNAANNCNKQHFQAYGGRTRENVHGLPGEHPERLNTYTNVEIYNPQRIGGSGGGGYHGGYAGAPVSGGAGGGHVASASSVGGGSCTGHQPVAGGGGDAGAPAGPGGPGGVPGGSPGRWTGLPGIPGSPDGGTSAAAYQPGGFGGGGWGSGAGGSTGGFSGTAGGPGGAAGFAGGVPVGGGFGGGFGSGFGTGGMAQTSGTAAGGRAGGGGFGPTGEQSGAPTGRTGATGPGGRGAGGPMGSGRRGEDDGEHASASYLISEDNGETVVGDLPLTAPSVIGE